MDFPIKTVIFQFAMLVTTTGYTRRAELLQVMRPDGCQIRPQALGIAQHQSMDLHLVIGLVKRGPKTLALPI